MPPLTASTPLCQGLEFLHEKQIAHRDIHPSNTVMNVLATPGEDLHNLRVRGSVRYAFIDFDASVAFPEDADLHALRVERVMRNPVRYIGLPPGMCNPFKDDVLCLTAINQTMVRVSVVLLSTVIVHANAGPGNRKCGSGDRTILRQYIVL